MKTVLGLQIYSIRDIYFADKANTLKEVKRIGYDAVEMFGGMDTPAVEVKKMIDDAGLVCCGYHTLYDWLSDENFEKTIEYNKILGNKFIIVPMLPHEMTETTQSWLSTCEKLQALNEKVRSHGMMFGFHSHGREHTILDDGNWGWKLYGENTSDDLIMQLDLGNCYNAGMDPIPEYEKYAHRGATVHYKPFSLTTGYVSPIGEDSIDWKKVIDITKRSGVCEYAIVEYESNDALTNVEKCAKALIELGIKD